MDQSKQDSQTTNGLIQPDLTDYKIMEMILEQLTYKEMATGNAETYLLP